MAGPVVDAHQRTQGEPAGPRPSPIRGPRTVKRVVVRRVERDPVDAAVAVGGPRAAIVSTECGSTLPGTAPRLAGPYDKTGSQNHSGSCAAPRDSFEAGERVEFQRARTLAISHYAFALLVFGGMFFV